MSKTNVKGMIHDLFTDMNSQMEEIIRTSTTANMATKRIMEYVSSTVASNSLGYISALYSSLSKKTLSEEVFQNVENANRFYELGLRKKLVEAYEFDVENVSAYKAGIDFKEINRIYASAGAAVGSATVGGILLGVLSGIVDIPMVVIIAGAVLAGVAGGSVTYAKVVPEINKKQYAASVFSFMKELEDSMNKWVDDVVRFYNQQVAELKKAL